MGTDRARCPRRRGPSAGSQRLCSGGGGAQTHASGDSNPAAGGQEASATAATTVHGKVERELQGQINQLAALVTSLRTQLHLALPLTASASGVAPAVKATPPPLQAYPYLQTRLPLFSSTAETFAHLTQTYLAGLKNEAGFISCGGFERARRTSAGNGRTCPDTPVGGRGSHFFGGGAAAERTSLTTRRRVQRSRWRWCCRSGAASPTWRRTTTRTHFASIGSRWLHWSAASRRRRFRPCPRRGWYGERTSAAHARMRLSCAPGRAAQRERGWWGLVRGARHRIKGT